MLPVAEQPESILYFYLTAPRVAAPRWFHEGIAVFVDTWMAGGLGRAQSGYDEMVFRSMVKDDAPFYDPLGLVSEGHESRLPGRDQLVSLRHALHDLAGAPLFAREGDRLDGAPRWQPRLLLGAVPPGVRHQRSSEAWAAWVTDERAFQRANLAAIRKHPVTPYRDVTSRALGSVSRAYFDPVAKKIYAAFNYPGVAAHVGAIDVDERRRRAHSWRSRARDLHGCVARLGSRTSACSSTPPTTRVARSRASRSDDGQDAPASEGRAHRRPRLQPANVALGHPPLNGIVHAGAHPAAVHAWEQVVIAGRTAPWSTTSTSRPTARTLAASFGEISGKQDVRVLSIDGAAERRRDADGARSISTQSVPNSFTFSPDGRYLYGSSYLHRRLEHLPLRARDASTLEAVSNTETGFLPPGAARRR